MSLTTSQKELADFVPSLLLRIRKEGRKKATSDGQVVEVDATEKDIENAIKYLQAYDITKMPGVGSGAEIGELAKLAGNYKFPSKLPDMEGKDAATA